MTARDLPILFSGPMVRALIREIEQPGRGKTQTRRIIKKPGLMAAPYTMRATSKGVPVSIDDWGAIQYRPLPYSVGDQLYAREHWRVDSCLDKTAPRDMPTDINNRPYVQYEADGPGPGHGILEAGKLRLGMHMPRWASRITLTVTDVRVERLQDISEADAHAEGIETILRPDGTGIGVHVVLDEKVVGGWVQPRARDVYETLWEHINGTGSWAANPWVAAYTFTVALGNIDQIGRAE